MEFQAAVIDQENFKCVVVVVDAFILDNKEETMKTMRTIAPKFPGYPVVLMIQNYAGTPFFYGRMDVTDVLKTMRLRDMAWENYKFEDEPGQ